MTSTAPARARARALRLPVIAAAAVALVLVLGLAGCSMFSAGGGGDAGRDASGTPTSANTAADVFSIKVGDCLNDAAASGTVTTAPIVPCSQRHDSEAYKSIEMADGDFPGDAAVTSAANEGCASAFSDFVGISYDDSDLSISYYFPTKESWKNGDRQIMCTVYDDGVKTTGTLKDAKR